MSIAKKVSNTINDNERGYLCRNYTACSTLTPVQSELDISVLYNKYIPTNDVVSIYPARTTKGDVELTRDLSMQNSLCKLAYIAVVFEFVDGSVLGVVIDKYRVIDDYAINLCNERAVQAAKTHENKLVECFVEHCYEVLHDSER